MGIKLDIGCGNHTVAGFEGLDKRDFGQKHTCDLDKDRIPLPDNSVSEIYAKDCIEHIGDLIYCMGELWRVAEPGAKLTIICPYYKTKEAFRDPTHIRFMTEESMRYFCMKGNDYLEPYFGAAKLYNPNNRWWKEKSVVIKGCMIEYVLERLP